MTALPQRSYISPGEYLYRERNSLDKHEYYDGQVFMMAGASEEHNTIALNITASLHGQLKKRQCKVYPSDLRVFIPATGLYTYPDVSVVCGKPQLMPDKFLDTLMNPTLIVEVLSPSTDSYDKGEKFDQYRSLESLSEYVLVSQNAKRISRYTKQPDGSWVLMDFIGEGTEIGIPSIECVLTMDDIYEKVEFEV